MDKCLNVSPRLYEDLILIRLLIKLNVSCVPKLTFLADSINNGRFRKIFFKYDHSCRCRSFFVFSLSFLNNSCFCSTENPELSRDSENASSMSFSIYQQIWQILSKLIPQDSASLTNFSGIGFLPRSRYCETADTAFWMSIFMAIFFCLYMFPMIK